MTKEDPMTYTKELQSQLSTMQLQLEAAWDEISHLEKEIKKLQDKTCSQ